MDDPADISKLAEMKHTILSEDGTLKYGFMISLQKITMVKIVSSLWTHQHTEQQIVNLCGRRKMMMLNAFENTYFNILAKVSHLLLPNSICEELRYLITVFKDSIAVWIKYHDERILIPEKSEYSAVDLIHNISWTTRGKIDYLQTAENILANSNSCLSDNHKYKLACTYCLEDEISHLSSKLVNRFPLSEIQIDIEPMVYFWRAQITGNRIDLNNPRYYWDGNQRHDGAMSINEHIFQLLLNNYGTIRHTTMNSVPIQFMWNKLSKEEKAKNTALFKNIHNPDFIISVLTNLDCVQQQNMLKECSDAVLYGILSEWWWWGKYFLPTALNVLDIMDPLSFWKVLRELNRQKIISSVKNTYEHFKSLFKLLWQDGSTQCKEFIFRDKVLPLDEFVIHALDWEKDVDVIEVIFKDLNIEQKKSIAFGEDSIDRCVDFIYFDQWDLLDLFIRCTLSSEEDISNFKQRLMRHSGRKLALSFLRLRNFQKMQRFVNWAFKSEEEIAHFQQSLDYTVLPLTK